MPNIFKAFSKAKAERYQFPDTDELVVTPPEPEEGPPGPGGAFVPIEGEEPGLGSEPDPGPEPEPPEPKEDLVSFAQIQAEQIVADAQREAEELREQARQQAEQESESVFAKARESGYQDGYVQGMAQAAAEAAQFREEQAAALEEEVHRFLQQAGAELDRQMDRSVDDLRDLAMAVAEKVVCVSLRSSGDVIARMIQNAIDKRKKKEWVHIYIAECDAKRLTQIPASLSAALSALSDRVRIIPMADDESGTCIIEMPDEIVDASAATQLSNLRTILMDTANSGPGGGF